jgi:uncharacterized membrane protein YkoI
MKNTHQKVSTLIAAACFLLSAGSLAAPHSKKVISQEQAQATALQKVPGTVKSSELEHEAGKQIYSFDIQGNDGNLHEVWIDAHNGKFLKQKVESAAEEAKESKTGHH